MRLSGFFFSQRRGLELAAVLVLIAVLVGILVGSPVLVGVLIGVLIGVLVLVLVLILILSIILLVVHCSSSEKLMAARRGVSVTGFSGFIPGPENQAGNKTAENGNGDSTGGCF